MNEKASFFANGTVFASVILIDTIEKMIVLVGIVLLMIVGNWIMGIYMN